MFRGRSEHTIDQKGRIVLPAKYRELLLKKYDNTLFITNFDNALLAYPTEEWLVVEEKVQKLPSGNPRVRAFKRFFISSAIECPVDKQGRILIPPSLKSYAKLEKNIIVAGQITHFELWDSQRFYENIKMGQEFEASEEVSDVINELGL
jgi:MraZ protein